MWKRVEDFLAQRPVLFALFASIVLYVPGLLATLVLVDARPPAPGPLHPYVNALFTIAISPVAETLVMIPMMAVGEQFLPNRHAAVLTCAGVWAAIHATLVPQSVPFVFWGFTVLGYVYVYWRSIRPHSFLWVVMLTHAFANLPAAIVAVVLS
jgi:hypothetical protein